MRRTYNNTRRAFQAWFMRERGMNAKEIGKKLKVGKGQAKILYRKGRELWERAEKVEEQKLFEVERALDGDGKSIMSQCESDLKYLWSKYSMKPPFYATTITTKTPKTMKPKKKVKCWEKKQIWE